jgi:hypothetical protein
LSFEKPGLDERLALGIAIAAAAMGDRELAQPGAERPAGERGGVVAAQRERSRRHAAIGDCVIDDADRLLRTAANIEGRSRISRVQQSIAAFR